AAFCADGDGQRIPFRRSCRQRRKWKKQQTPSVAAYVGPEAGTLSPDRMDGGAIPISPLQRAAGRSSAGSLRNIAGDHSRILLDGDRRNRQGNRNRRDVETSLSARHGTSQRS